jgi:hypothetical protein
MEAIALNNDTQPGTLIGRLRDRKHPAIRDDFPVPDNADERGWYKAGYNKAINDAIDLFGEWLVDLLEEYPDLTQDMREHDRQRLEEYREKLDEIEAEAEDEETVEQVRELRGKLEKTERKLRVLEQASSNSGEHDE